MATPLHNIGPSSRILLIQTIFIKSYIFTEIGFPH